MSFSERPVYQDVQVADITSVKPKSAPSRAAIKLIKPNDARRAHGNEIACDDGSRWKYNKDCAITVTATMSEFIMQPDDLPGTGRWLRREGFADLKFAIGFATADATVLATLPTGCTLRSLGGYWEPTTSFSGGASSAIGLSGPSPHNSKGDLLGGSGGDVAAALTAGAMRRATVGTDQAAGIMLTAGDTIKFDQVVSAFTAGAGYVHLQVQIILNLGA